MWWVVWGGCRGEGGGVEIWDLVGSGSFHAWRRVTCMTIQGSIEPEPNPKGSLSSSTNHEPLIFHSNLISYYRTLAVRLELPIAKRSMLQSTGLNNFNSNAELYT